MVLVKGHGQEDPEVEREWEEEEGKAVATLLMLFPLSPPREVLGMEGEGVDKRLGCLVAWRRASSFFFHTFCEFELDFFAYCL
jgi:hypothetical protein